MRLKILIAILLSALTIKAADIEMPDFSYNIISMENLTVEVVAISTTENDISIPSTVTVNGKTFTVIKIADELFKENRSIENINIPNSIETIGQNAFYSCSKLKSLVIEDGERELLLDIGYASLLPVFGDCVNLKSVYFGRNIKLADHIHRQASPFYNNASLTEVTFSSYVTSIPHYMFYKCKGLVSISLPDGIQNIGVRSFSECENLSGVILSKTLKTIGSQAFEDCTVLSSIILPNSLETIGTDAFRNTAISEISIPANVDCIEGGAFLGTKLQTLRIEDSTEPIKMPTHSNQYTRNQFDYTELSEVYLGRNIDYFENEKYIKEGPFPGTITKITLGSNVTNINPFLFEYAHFNNIELSENIISIGKNAFQNSSLNSIIIPSSVQTIDREAFSNCANLSRVSILNDNLSLSISLFKNCVSLTEIHLPIYINTIPYQCFSGCSSMSNIEFPSTLREISNNAFENCVNLTDIEFPQDLETIGSDSFKDCSKLSSIRFANNVKELGATSFTNCPLNSISIQCQTPPKIQNNTFDNKVYLNADLYVPYDAISDYNSADGWKFFSSIKDISSGVENIVFDKMRQIEIFDINGNRIYQNDKDIKLPSGIYIIRNGSITKKFIIH